MFLDRESGYQEIRVQDTRGSEYQENKRQKILKPDARMS
jgi:hypothetical protein